MADAPGTEPAVPELDPVVAIRRILLLGTLLPFIAGGSAFAGGWSTIRAVVGGAILATFVIGVLAWLGVLGLPLHEYRALSE